MRGFTRTSWMWKYVYLFFIFITFYFILFYFTLIFLSLSFPWARLSVNAPFVLHTFFPSIFVLTSPFFFLNLCHSFFLTLFCLVYSFFPLFPPSLFLSFSRPFESMITMLYMLGMAPPPAVDVNVISHHMQRYAVWFGGSMLTSTVCPVYSRILIEINWGYN